MPGSSGASPEFACHFLVKSAALRDERGAPKTFFSASLAGLEEVEAEEGRCRALLTVTPPLCHYGEALHGGAIGRAWHSPRKR